MIQKGWGIACVLFLLALLFSFYSGLAAQEEGPETIDPKVKQVLQQTEEYIKSLDSFRVKIDINVKVESEGMKQEMASFYTMALQRPDKLAMVLEKGMMGGTLVSDGKDVHFYTPMTKKYTKKEAPESLNDLDVLSITGGVGETGPALVEFLIRDNLYETLRAKVMGAQYVGEEVLEGIKYHRLKFLAKEADFDVWVKAGEKPLPYKIVPDMTKSLEKTDEMPAQMKDMKYDVQLLFKNWEENIELPDDIFTFTPPEDAQADSPAGPHPLLGKPAPPFKLEMLEGGEFDLSAQRDKNIVILDFWATWCGPCRKVMPTMEEVAGEYKDRGVLLIAVNLRESVEKIQTFLLEQGIHPEVALDKDGEVGKLYQARAIPQTVIIDKDGTVQAVHVGATPDLKEALKKELDDLLAGKKLVSPEPKEKK